MQTTEQHAAQVAAFAEKIINNVERVIIGKRSTIELLLVAILSDGHVLLEDVPGVGKTTMAKALARSIGGDFKRIQFTPDLLPSDISGVSFFNQKQSEFEFRPGPIFTNILLADEINRATPRTQSALLEAMEERTVTIEGDTMTLPQPFLVLATENPIELEGTFPLPEAQLDRFLLQVEIGYPGVAEEDEMLRRLQHSHPITELDAVASPEDLVQAVEATRAIHVEDDVRRYIVQIVRGTREHEAVSLGVSPRGSLALFRSSQAVAGLRGRGYVTPDDVKVVAPAVLSHRILISPEARLRGRNVRAIIREVLEQQSAPVERV